MDVKEKEGRADELSGRGCIIREMEKAEGPAIVPRVSGRSGSLRLATFYSTDGYELMRRAQQSRDFLAFPVK